MSQRDGDEYETPVNWVTSILRYIRNSENTHADALAKCFIAARKLTYYAANFVIEDGEMYKRGYQQPLFKCVDEEKGHYNLREVH